MNQNFVKLMSPLTKITETAIFTYPITGMRNTDKSVFVFVDLSKIGVDSFDSFGLTAIPKFLALYDIVGEDAETTIKDGIVHIKNEKSSFRFVTADVHTLQSVYSVNLDMLSKIEKATTTALFELDKATLIQIKKAANLLGLNNIVFDITTSGVVVTATSMNKITGENASSNEFNVGVKNVMQSNDKVSITLDCVNLDRIPTGNYIVKIAKGENSYISRFESKDVEGLIIVSNIKAQ